MKNQKNTIQTKAINTLRMLAVDMVEEANSGHPGMPMGCAPLVYNLYQNFLRFNPRNPDWINRDRFVLSAGHGSALIYSILHLTGYKLSLKDLKNFRQLGSKTPGHPECRVTPGVEATTGPLGQGFANGVGMALGAKILADRFNRPGFEIFDYTTYALVSDGDMMEGVSHEAASFAANMNLGKLIYFYDANDISIEGDTSLSFSEDVKARFEAYNWHVQVVKNGENIKALSAAITRAQKNKKPSLIVVKTKIGQGSPNMAGMAKVHGTPLGKEEITLTKQNLCLQNKKFYISKLVLKHFRKKIHEGKFAEEKWQKMFKRYKKKYPDLAKQLTQEGKGELPQGWKNDLNNLFKDIDNISTREASGIVINKLAQNIPNLVGGSADLAPSTKTYLSDFPELKCFSRVKNIRNIHFGVREHAMGGIVSGLAYTGGIISFGSTFLVFSDYMRASMRVASLSKLNVKYVLTHDSIAVGEDGPTHQPIEQLMSLRLIPGLITIRPADGYETREAWKVAMQLDSPVALILSRQKLPMLDQKKYTRAINLKKGAYLLYESGESKKLDVILIATGSEVSLALEVASRMEKRGRQVRVVSVPSWELFDRQSNRYKQKVLIKGVKKVSIEAGVTTGWQKYTGVNGLNIGVDEFGASGRMEDVVNGFGFEVSKVVRKVLKFIKL